MQGSRPETARRRPGHGYHKETAVSTFNLTTGVGSCLLAGVLDCRVQRYAAQRFYPFIGENIFVRYLFVSPKASPSPRGRVSRTNIKVSSAENPTLCQVVSFRQICGDLWETDLHASPTARILTFLCRPIRLQLFSSFSFSFLVCVCGGGGGEWHSNEQWCRLFTCALGDFFFSLTFAVYAHLPVANHRCHHNLCCLQYYHRGGDYQCSAWISE